MSSMMATGDLRMTCHLSYFPWHLFKCDYTCTDCMSWIIALQSRDATESRFAIGGEKASYAPAFSDGERMKRQVERSLGRSVMEIRALIQDNLEQLGSAAAVFRRIGNTASRDAEQQHSSSVDEETFQKGLQICLGKCCPRASSSDSASPSKLHQQIAILP